MKRPLLVLSSAACLMSLTGACETDLVDDPSFQLWCGDELCAWDLEDGEIRKVSTWHDYDYGVELVGAPVVLSQQSRDIASCVRVEVTSQVEANAEVSVEVDEEGDGEIDWVIPVEASEDFVRRVKDVSLYVSTDGVFYVRKTGPGQAVVGRLRISEECRD